MLSCRVGAADPASLPDGELKTVGSTLQMEDVTAHRVPAGHYHVHNDHLGR